MTNKVREVVRTRERMKTLMATSSRTKGIQSTGGEERRDILGYPEYDIVSKAGPFPFHSTAPIALCAAY